MADVQQRAKLINEALLRLQVFVRDYEQGQHRGNTENIKKAFNYRGQDYELRTKKVGALAVKRSVRD